MMHGPINIRFTKGLINAFGETQKIREHLRGCKKEQDVRVEPRIRIKPSKTRGGERHLKIKTTRHSTTCP